MSVPLSILDLAHVGEGETIRDSFDASVTLAQHAENWGYQRIWYAEHHNMKTIASVMTAVAILAGLDSILGAVRAELDGHYDNRIFLSGFIANTAVAVLLTFVGDRLGIDLYLVALIAFGLRIFQNVALIRRHFL